MEKNENDSCCGLHQSASSQSEIVDTKNQEYICPMHPEIRRPKPGDCPICGMALELHTINANEPENIELKEMTNRFWVSAILTIFVAILAMGPMIGISFDSILSKNVQNWIQFLFSTPVVLWGALPFFKKGWQSIIHKKLNMFTLISIGVGIAYIYSFILLFINQNLSKGLYFESAAMITTLVLLGQVLELRARAQTQDSIKALLHLLPDMANLIHPDGKEAKIFAHDIKVGDILRIRPGEKIPIDGIVIEGKSSIDESMITGESMPVLKEKDAILIGATVNTTGSLIMRVTKVGQETLIAKIIQRVSVAQRSRAPIQRLADVISSYFVPLVLIIAIITFAVWFWVGPEPKFVFAIMNAVAVLIIACPCALGLATPMSIMVGMGKGAISGILIKNAAVLEVMEKMTILVVDKTGTLTEGKPVLVTIKTIDSVSEEAFLTYAASLENGSEHPLAQSIVKEAEKRGIALKNLGHFESETGKGVKGEIEGHQIILGNKAIFDTLGIDLSSFLEVSEKLRQGGQTIVFLARDNKVLGLLGIEDPIKESTKDTLKKLQDMNIKVMMVTGDHETTAHIIAEKIGIKDVKAGILPNHKADIVKALKANGAIVAMAGDGINDSPALSEADIGIAMGTGTDIAIESADVTLVKGDLIGILKAYSLSKNVMRNIRQNLFFAFFYNIVGVPIAAGILYPFFGILLSPMIAAAAMSLSSVSVILNALRLRNVQI
ncbi:MAG: copper-translocating P-type ATPase [Alphaproteobacteria bacterium]|nr:copper-translocating P-type ATPase [Alphaproteobacteria bacterium]